MRKLLHRLTLAGIIAALLATVLLIDVSITMNTLLDIPERSFINLKRGSSIKTLANDLHRKGLLEHTEYLTLWARLNGMTTRLKAGEYSLHPGDSLADLLDNMVAGKVEQYKLTLVEGWTYKEMMQAIYLHPQIKRTLADVSPNRVMLSLGFTEQHPEGLFYPDTYFIQKNTSEIEVLKRAYQMMATLLDKEWQQREQGLPLKSAYETLILASIVEKESAVIDERTKIAGVFINRLRKKMRLQTDPTVIYGMGDSYKGDIRFRDLREDTPYNTYTRNGLPPTPIAMPGLAAIRAVLHPAKVDALYFVAFGDGSGRHHFSDNLADHEKAVNLYQKPNK